jgi:ribosomal protein S21
MVLEIKRKPKETTQSLIRRFSQQFRRSGILIQARKIRFKDKIKSPGAVKKAALRKEELKKHYQKLAKLG